MLEMQEEVRTADPDNLRDFRLYMVEYNIWSILLRTHLVIIPIACSSEAGKFFRMGYKTWRVTRANPDAVQTICEKLSPITDPNGLFSMAEYWAVKLRQRNPDLAALCVQQHLLKLFDADLAGLRKAKLPDGALNCRVPVSTGGVTTSGALCSPVIVAIMCLLNSFAGWDPRPDSPYSAAVSLLTSGNALLDRCASVCVSFLGGPYAAKVVVCFVLMRGVYKTPAAAFCTIRWASLRCLNSSRRLATGALSYASSIALASLPRRI